MFEIYGIPWDSTFKINRMKASCWPWRCGPGAPGSFWASLPSPRPASSCRTPSSRWGRPLPLPSPPATTNISCLFTIIQCCGFGMFYPDPRPQIRIFSIPDPRSRAKHCYHKEDTELCCESCTVLFHPCFGLKLLRRPRILSISRFKSRPPTLAFGFVCIKKKGYTVASFFISGRVCSCVVRSRHHRSIWPCMKNLLTLMFWNGSTPLENA